VNTADHEFSSEPSRQLIICRPEFSQRGFDHIYRLNPPKQPRVGLRHLQRDLGSLPRVAGQTQRLLQVRASGRTPDTSLRAGGLPENHHPLIWHWWL
jgi:hypothetical protein